MRLHTLAMLGGAVLVSTALAGCGMTSGPLAPQEVSMTTNMTGAQQVPPVTTPGSGRTRAWYNRETRTLTWAAEWQGLSGPATAAHFHGPAAPGANAGVQVPIPHAGPMPRTGAAVLTQAQEADLLAGRWYVNVHTAAHPGGEIRGQVTPGS